MTTSSSNPENRPDAPTAPASGATQPVRGGSPAGPDSWVAEAIAAQEEHIRRVRSCTGINNSHADASPGLAHSWDTFSTAPGAPKYQACWRCRVTRTRADYDIKTGTGSDPDAASTGVRP